VSPAVAGEGNLNTEKHRNKPGPSCTSDFYRNFIALEKLYKKLRVKEIIEEVPGFKTFVFEDSHSIDYMPGQYITLVWFLNGEEIRRSYSITSTPVLNEPLSIGVKRIPNGLVSRIMTDSVEQGSELITIGAGGFFILPGDIAHFRQLVFFAAGSGITPVYSLIKTILHSHPQIRVSLIYSNASPAKTIFYNELEILQASFAERFFIRYLFSNEVQLSKARLHRDLIFEILRQYPFDAQTLYYICGPESYMRLCNYTLSEAGVRPGAIRMEKFVSPPKYKPKQDPPDKKDHRISINMGGERYSFIQSYPDSILAAAKKNQIALPYSCETGKCGSCALRCIVGKVWHSNNEVLTEKELEKGLILTCVGYPVNGDIILEIR
jgi:ferredoxin-NADP reductase